MDRIAIELGPISIYWYSITLLLAILCGAFIFFKLGKKEKYKEDFLTNLVFYGVIWALIGARIYYVIFNFDYYLSNPLEILAVWNGGLAIHGGIIAGAAFYIYYCKKHKKSILKVFDLTVPCLIIGQAIGRWGNFFNGEAHGPEVARKTLESLPIPNFVINGMNIEGVYYHPTFFYESVWCFLGFILLIVLVTKYRKKLKPGTITGIYFMWYSLCRFFIESLRTDSLMLGSMKVAQLVSIALFLLGLFLIIYKKKDTRVNRLKERTEKNE